MQRILLAPDPSLREISQPCDFSDSSLKKLAKNLIKLMYKNNGCGIAAPQVGVKKRLIVIDCNVDAEEDERDPIVLLNPELIETKGEPVSEGEGCLSCPGITVPVTRRPWARVQYFDFDGEMWEIEGDELLGRCLQHEIDHLNGITLFESCDPDVRLQILSDYKAARLAGAKPGDTAADMQKRLP